MSRLLHGIPQPSFYELKRSSTRLTKRRNCSRHHDRLPTLGISHEITEVQHIINTPEVPEPDANFRSSCADVIVFACNTHKRKWEVMCEQQNAIANLHFARERPIDSLVLWKRILADR